jgi:hypothetical protein
MAGLKDNMFVLFTIVRAQGFHAQIAALFSSWHREPTVRGFAKTETALLLQRTITPRFSGQHQAWPDQQMVAIAASPGVPHALQILDSNLPPDSIHFG